MRVWNDGFFRGSRAAGKDLQVAYWTGKEIGAGARRVLSAGRKVLNYNDEYCTTSSGSATFVYRRGADLRAVDRLVLRGRRVASKYDDQILGSSRLVRRELARHRTRSRPYPDAAAGHSPEA